MRAAFGRLGIGLVILALVAASFPARALDVLPRSFSRSRQFVVYAREGPVRGAVGSLAEETKDGLLSVLGLSDDWKMPIVIDVRAPQPGLPDARPPVQLNLGQTGSGLKIELDLVTGEGSRDTRIRTELVRAILLELAYRGHDSLPAGRGYTPPPPWLVEGFSAYLANQEDGVSAHLFAALLPTTQALPIGEFLSKDPSAMDSTSRAVYQAYAYNLVCLLLQELNGSRQALVAFVRDLPNTSPEEARSAAALARHFPQLAASPDALEKWWTLGLARLSQFDHYEALSAEDTDRRLEDALTFRLTPGTGDPGDTRLATLHDDFRRVAASRRSRQALEGPRSSLLVLSGRANPLFHGIIFGYQEIVAQLERGKSGGVAEKLARLEAARRDVLKHREQIADYLNWYEATQIPTQSDNFNQYFRTARQVDADQRVHRPDPISAYLDSVDNEFR